MLVKYVEPIDVHCDAVSIFRLLCECEFILLKDPIVFKETQYVRSKMIKSFIDVSSHYNLILNLEIKNLKFMLCKQNCVLLMVDINGLKYAAKYEIYLHTWLDFPHRCTRGHQSKARYTCAQLITRHQEILFHAQSRDAIHQGSLQLRVL